MLDKRTSQAVVLFIVGAMARGNRLIRSFFVTTLHNSAMQRPRNAQIDALSKVLAEGNDDKVKKIGELLNLVINIDVDINNIPIYINDDQFIIELAREVSARPVPQDQPPPPRPDSLVKGLFASLPDNAESRLGVVVDRIEAFREEAASQLQAALNSYLATQKPETFEDKQNISNVINSNLESLNLAISFHGQACNLMATMSGGSPTGRFIIVPKGTQKPLITRVNLSDLLPLELTDNRSPHEVGSWRARAFRVVGETPQRGG